VQVPVDILKLAALVYAGVQAVKKSPWLEGLLEKFGGPWVGIALAIIAGCVGGFVEYGGDGVITWNEAGNIVAAILAAMGTHIGLSKVETATQKR